MRQPTTTRTARRAAAAASPAGAAPDQEASQSVTGARDRLRAWLVNHRAVAIDSLRRLLASPGTSLMTWTVIGIAIAMPIWIYLAVRNAEAISVGWEGKSQVSVFLKEGVSAEAAMAFRERLLTWDGLKSVKYVSPDQALTEFKKLSGFGEVVDTLPTNPLPGVLVVEPEGERLRSAEALFTRLGEQAEVESVSLDMQWVRRLYAMLRLANRVVAALGLVLACAVTLVIGNTVRLAIESRRAEIEVVKLVGGTDAFVRRPFLYTGFWFGAGGGLIALILVQISLVWMAAPVRELIGLYSSDFEVLGLAPGTALAVAAMSGGLGLVGAWLAVNRHLAAVDAQ